MVALSGAAGAYLVLRRALARARSRVRATVEATRPLVEAVLSEWLAGARTRASRDQALRLIVERMAAELMRE
jgi:hypothetical protein